MSILTILGAVFALAISVWAYVIATGTNRIIERHTTLVDEICEQLDAMDNAGTLKQLGTMEERISKIEKAMLQMGTEWVPCEWDGLGLCPKCGQEHDRCIPGYPPTIAMVHRGDQFGWGDK